MGKKILVPLDGSEQATEALSYTFSEFPDADITVINVIDPIDVGYTSTVGMPGYSEEWYEESKENANALFEEARELADEHGVTLTTKTEVGQPAQTIVDYAEEFDQIIMGSHGRSGVSRILLGSVAETVVRRSSVPVTVVR
ncbi:universal stress protein [Haladaptatus sp. T7]|uniref:universal stress protein n=1 Tax=Haladaptatus sp. T7 TaxID=2029368 RepID=UPI0021A25473|nr:universal stress protein [Haladaptatus sp. T7]GKZ12991.1 universal stress protein UspA [Haladaptatus sp. T7]